MAQFEVRLKSQSELDDLLSRLDGDFTVDGLTVTVRGKIQRLSGLQQWIDDLYPGTVFEDGENISLVADWLLGHRGLKRLEDGTIVEDV